MTESTSFPSFSGCPGLPVLPVAEGKFFYEKIDGLNKIPINNVVTKYGETSMEKKGEPYG